jgi:hypothetical protein
MFFFVLFFFKKNHMGQPRLGCPLADLELLPDGSVDWMEQAR